MKMKKLKKSFRAHEVKRVFQLRVIRAFRSTLEDMEEKRSVHSMRSTRSYLARPMSDISYVEEDTLSPTVGATGLGQSFTSGGRRSNSSGSNSRGMIRQSHLVTDSSSSAFIPVPNSSSISTNTGTTNTTTHQYLKVEGTSYRVHQKNAKNQSQRDSMQSRHSADAQTQSAESSFQQLQQQNSEELQTDSMISQEAVFTPTVFVNQPSPQQQQQLVGPPPCVQIVSSSPSPQPPPRVASPLLIQPVSASPVPPPPMQAGTAVTVQHAGGALQTHLLPSPIYGFGYDPSYCQYLGQGVDGFQYELVRRPSIGHTAPVELLPQPQQPQPHHVRRASGGIPYLTPNSMQGSFDSAVGPPSMVSQPPPPPLSSSPIFIQQPQPLSPRHLHHNPASSIQPIQRPNLMTNPHDWGPTNSGSGNGSSNNAAGASGNNDIPKLIHETSI